MVDLKVPTAGCDRGDASIKAQADDLDRDLEADISSTAVSVQPYLKADFSSDWIDGQNGAVRSYARIGYELTGGLVTVTAELGPEVLALEGSMKWAMSSAIYSYVQAAPGVELYAGWESLFSGSVSEQIRFNELTLGGLFKAPNGGVVLDPLTGLAASSDGYFLRLELKSLWASLSPTADRRYNAFIGWLSQRGRFSLNGEVGVSMFDLYSADIFAQLGARLDASIDMDEQTQFVVSLDYFFAPDGSAVSALGASLSLVYRF